MEQDSVRLSKINVDELVSYTIVDSSTHIQVSQTDLEEILAEHRGTMEDIQTWWGVKDPADCLKLLIILDPMKEVLQEIGLDYLSVRDENGLVVWAFLK